MKIAKRLAGIYIFRGLADFSIRKVRERHAFDNAPQSHRQLAALPGPLRTLSSLSDTQLSILATSRSLHSTAWVFLETLDRDRRRVDSGHAPLVAALLATPRHHSSFLRHANCIFWSILAVQTSDLTRRRVFAPPSRHSTPTRNSFNNDQSEGPFEEGRHRRQARRRSQNL